jgi:hypothetical protein
MSTELVKTFLSQTGVPGLLAGLYVAALVALAYWLSRPPEFRHRLRWVFRLFFLAPVVYALSWLILHHPEAPPPLGHYQARVILCGFSRSRADALAIEHSLFADLFSLFNASGLTDIIDFQVPPDQPPADDLHAANLATANGAQAVLWGSSILIGSTLFVHPHVTALRPTGTPVSASASPIPIALAATSRLQSPTMQLALALFEILMPNLPPFRRGNLTLPRPEMVPVTQAVSFQRAMFPGCPSFLKLPTLPGPIVRSKTASVTIILTPSPGEKATQPGEATVSARVTHRRSIPADVLTLAMLARNNTDQAIHNAHLSERFGASLHLLPGSLALNGHPIPITHGIATLHDHTISVNAGVLQPGDRLLLTFAGTVNVPKGVTVRARVEPPTSPQKRP